MVFEGLLAPIFDPLLKLPILAVVLIMSFLITLITTIIYKYTTNQSLMKDLKDEMKAFQKEMKELKSDPKKMMEVQKKAMQTNMKYMSHSMRSMLFTFIPIILIFGWMNANLAYLPVMPDQQFITTVQFDDSVTGQVELVLPNGISTTDNLTKDISKEVKWVLTGKEGNYNIEYKVGSKSYDKEVVITRGQKYIAPVKVVKDGTVRQISIDHQKIQVLNIVGWKLGWLGSYIIFSIIFSAILRKLFKVY